MSTTNSSPVLPAWIQDALSEEQASPLRRSSRHACVFAGAGSGKTRTLVHMLAADLAAGIAPASIVAFTFTEKAADELLTRIHGLVDQHFAGLNISGLYIGTIHGWSLQYLREKSSFYNFEPLDELQVKALVSRLYDALDLNDAYDLSFPRALDPFINDLEILYNENLHLDNVPARIKVPLERFLTVLRQNRLLTFGGMVRSATESLQQDGPIQSLSRLYVDEYQDVNPAQVSLIKSMMAPSTKLVVVGDDLQCIYQWRGSDVEQILNFASNFPDSSVHRLSTNYRSRSSIVGFANQIAQNVEVRDRAKAMTVKRSDDAATCCVNWVSVNSEEEQAKEVASIITRLIANGVRAAQVAVLLRSVLSAGGPIVDELRVAGIPVNCPPLSRGASFINEFLIPILDWLAAERREPKNEVEERDIVAWNAALWTLARSWVAEHVTEERFWDALTAWADLVDKQRNDAYNVRRCLYEFLNSCGVRMAPDDQDLTVGLGIATQIIRSVEEVHRRRLPEHSRRTSRGILREVVFGLRREQERFGESVPLNAGVDGVAVCTVHQAKGLEWPVVIIPMLLQRRFPVRSSGHGTSFPDSVAKRYGTTVDDERRLFYVACTRARERLFLFDPAAQRPQQRSVFLNELSRSGGLRAVDAKALPQVSLVLDLKALAARDNAPSRIGVTDLLMYVDCPYQFGLRRVAGVQPAVGDDLGYGRGLHELIQRRLESGTAWSEAELKAQADANVHLPLASASVEEQSRSAILNRLRTLQELGVFRRDVETELDFEVRLGHGLIHGIIDVVEVERDQAVVIRDWKSNVHPELMPRYRRQLQFYAYALQQGGRNVARADLVDVGASAKDRSVKTIDVAVDSMTLQRLERDLAQAIDGIRGGRFPPTPSHTVCLSCDVRLLCARRFES